MTINVEKVNKLTNKLNDTKEKIEALQEVYNNTWMELQDIFGVDSQTASSKATPTQTTTTGKTKGKPVSEKVFDYISKHPGSDLPTIAKALKEQPKVIGLSLYHLGPDKKGVIYSDKGGYYVSMSLSAAAKGTPSEETEEDENL